MNYFQFLETKKLLLGFILTLFITNLATKIKYIIICFINKNFMFFETTKKITFFFFFFEILIF
jgi:hypothetical protein